ncbi:hypothetical protein AMCSP09_000506 [Streptococcus pneumoniae 2081074]|nr:hypothetical protein AMCSP09_000506 [Streptococcus pneumoniae 2081074]
MPIRIKEETEEYYELLPALITERSGRIGMSDLIASIVKDKILGY